MVISLSLLGRCPRHSKQGAKHETVIRSIFGLFCGRAPRPVSSTASTAITARTQVGILSSRQSLVVSHPSIGNRQFNRQSAIVNEGPHSAIANRQSPMNILVVEDDGDIAALIAHYLEKVGHRVDRLASGSDVLPRLRKSPSDLVILDLMLPGMDGLIVCQAMRADPALAAIPIIMVTARGEESDRVSGLELGADDYVTKPFSPKELTARVTALLRRAGRATTSAPLRYGPIVIDVERHHVTLDGEDVRLTAKEFLLLQYLVQHKGRVLSRDLLLSDVWGYHYTGGTRTVDVHIRRLREKLPPLSDGIETIKQFGYKLTDQP
jgi:DNA-binding response OmpR family regulator